MGIFGCVFLRRWNLDRLQQVKEMCPRSEKVKKIRLK